MGRKPKAETVVEREIAPDDNTKLTDAEQQALVTYYALKIIEDQRKVAALKVSMDLAKKVVNGHFKRLKADLLYSRKEFEAEVLEKMQMTEAEDLAAEKRRARLRKLAGLQAGQQLDLEDVIRDTADDLAMAYANGLRAGRRADDPVAPPEVAAVALQEWLRGWHDGQAENAMKLGIAAKVLEARAKSAASTVELVEDTGDDDEIDEDDVRKEARRLKDAGWTEPTADEAFEDA